MLEARAQPVAAPAPTRRAVGIAGLGVALPSTVVPNAEVAGPLGVEPAWIERRTGIRTRRRLEPSEPLAALALEAAHRALDDAGVAATSVDTVVAATFTADHLTPALAPLVAHGLGTRAAAFDVNAACVGFLTGLDVACALIEAGRAEQVLLVAAERLTRHLDPEDRRVAPLFGDGAGAALVRAAGDGEGGLGPVVLRSDGGLADLIVAARADGLIRMEGHDTFVNAVSALTEATLDACAAAGLALADVDLFVFHQANSRILDAVAERLGIDRGRVIDVIADLGNTSAATLPLALAAARETGRLHAGDRLVLGAMGAGFVYGAGVLTWA